MPFCCPKELFEKLVYAIVSVERWCAPLVRDDVGIVCTTGSPIVGFEYAFGVRGDAAGGRLYMRGCERQFKM